MIILDTNILIDLFKGDKKTLELLENIKNKDLAVSIITAMELYYGAINKREI